MQRKTPLGWGVFAFVAIFYWRDAMAEQKIIALILFWCGSLSGVTVYDLHVYDLIKS